VLGSVVDILDVLDVNHAAAISVQLLEGFLDKSQSGRSQITSDDSEELIVADSAISVYVKGIEDDIDVLTGYLHSEILDGLSEFVSVQTL
jgi:hypothetical protein